MSCKPLFSPSNHKAEKDILASILNDKQMYQLGCQLLKVSCFDHPTYQTIFSYCLILYSKDLMYSLENLIKHIQIDKGPLTKEFMLDLNEVYYSYSPGLSFEEYSKELNNQRLLREGIQYSRVLAENFAVPGQDANKVFLEASGKLCSLVDSQVVETKCVDDILNDFDQGKSFEEYREWAERMKNQGLSLYRGIGTGFSKLDHALGTLQNGKLYYCGARASMGKTTFMLNIIGQICCFDQCSVGVISLEMKAQDILTRLGCIMANVNFNRFEDIRFSYAEKESLNDVFDFLKSLNNIYIEDPSSMSIEILKVRAKRMVEFLGVKIIFIDYLTRIKTDKRFNSKHLEIDYISKELQNLARELDVPVFVLSQLNRESGKCKYPSLTDFRESGSIEEDADACLLLHRPEYYDQDDCPGVVQVIVAKNRLRGILGTIKMKCDKSVSEKYYESKQENERKVYSPYKD